jgi:hypothetical protein
VLGFLKPDELGSNHFYSFYLYTWLFVDWTFIFILFRNISALKFLLVNFILNFFNVIKHYLDFFVGGEGEGN